MLPLLFLLWIGTGLTAMVFGGPLSLPKETVAAQTPATDHTDSPDFQHRMVHLAAPALPAYVQYGPENRSLPFATIPTVVHSRPIWLSTPFLLYRLPFALHYHLTLLYPFHTFW